MPLDFDTFLISVLALFGAISFSAHRRRRNDYKLRLGDSATSIPMRSNRMLLLLALLAVVASGGVVLGAIQLVTAPGPERLVGLIAIAGALLFFATAYRESTPLVGQHGFAIPYYNLFLPWSAIESIDRPDADAARAAGIMTLLYRSSNGTRTLHLRIGRRTGASAVAVVERFRKAHDESHNLVDASRAIAPTPSI